jgi:hypothetical protein
MNSLDMHWAEELRAGLSDALNAPFLNTGMARNCVTELERRGIGIIIGDAEKIVELACVLADEWVAMGERGQRLGRAHGTAALRDALGKIETLTRDSPLRKVSAPKKTPVQP